MTPTDFSKFLTDFLADYLPLQKNVSRNTIKSYRDTFKLLLRFCEEDGLPVEKVTMLKLSVERIERFLQWLEKERNCSIATRNLRLTTIHSFFRFAQIESPQALYHYQQVLAMPMKRRRETTLVEHLSTDEIRILLEQPNKNTAKGRRDLALMSLMYDSGARVQEIIDLTVKDFFAGSNPVLILTGKGNKMRRVPIMKNTALILKTYISEKRLYLPHKDNHPLFTNNQHNKLTKEGVAYIIRKYALAAREESKRIPERVNCHMLRHSKAVHLLQAGVNLIYIRDFLGHSNIKTTEIYARTDSETKRQALENAYPELVDANLPEWNKNVGLMAWLTEL